MAGITFEEHVLKSDEQRPSVDWRRDLDPAIDITETIKAAKFNPKVEVATGLLEHDWTHDGKSHPYHAIVIAPDSNLLPGDKFAVSNESFEAIRR